MASLVKKVAGGSKKLQFSDKQLQISDTEEIMGAQILALPINSPTWGFSAPNVVFCEENFVTRRTFSNRLNFRGKEQLSSSPPPCPQSRRH